VATEIEDFERAVIGLGPRPLTILGSSISSDGRYGAALTLLPTANNYVMNNLYERTPEGWKDCGGGNGDIEWTALSDDGRGVLAFGGEAPPDVVVARIFYEEREHTVPVRFGHFFFVAWDTSDKGEPELLGFD
jgi:hypothetical protein